MASRSSPTSLLAALRLPILHRNTILSIPSTLLRPIPPRSPLTRLTCLTSRRAAHSIPRPPPPPPPPSRSSPEFSESESSRSSSPPPPPPPPRENESERPDPRGPAYYQLSFTCIPCGHRSHHNVSKQAYHRGSTLITCPGCRNRHVISDHLNIFGDRKVTVEDLMREKGRLVKRGSLGEDGDIEFWPEEDTMTLGQDVEGTREGEGKQ